jgi:hypothetical protein
MRSLAFCVAVKSSMAEGASLGWAGSGTSRCITLDVLSASREPFLLLLRILGHDGVVLFVFVVVKDVDRVDDSDRYTVCIRIS